MTTKFIVAGVHGSRGISRLVPRKLEPLGGVYNGIAGWGGAPEDDFVPVGPDCP